MVSINKNEAKKIVTAVVEGDGNDAVRYVGKRLGFYGLSIQEFEYDGFGASLDDVDGAFELKKLIMPVRNVGVAKCHPGDEFDIEVGKKVAVDKADKNYFTSFRKALLRWQVAMFKKIYQIYPDTFAEAVEKTNAWIDKQQKNK